MADGDGGDVRHGGETVDQCDGGGRYEDEEEGDGGYGEDGDGEEGRLVFVIEKVRRVGGGGAVIRMLVVGPAMFFPLFTRRCKCPHPPNRTKLHRVR